MLHGTGTPLGIEAAQLLGEICINLSMTQMKNMEIKEG